MGLSEDIVIASGKGAFVKLENGKQLIDLTSGATVTNLGHGNRKIARVVYDQLKQLENVYVFNTRQKIDYKQRLLQELNTGLDTGFYDDIIFLSSGSEAIDCAVKCVRANNPRSKIVSTYTSFHGRTVTGIQLSRLPFTNLIPTNSSPHLFFSYPGRIDEEKNSIAEFNDLVIQHKEDICALILEPYQGDGGLIFPSAAFFRGIAKICRENGIPLILDEIQSGFGRTGTMFYFQSLGILPDIICLGKAMANGIPCSCVAGSSGITKRLSLEHYSNSFGGNPIAMVAAREVLDIFHKEEILKSVEKKSRQFQQGLNVLKDKYPDKLRAIRGRGLIFGIELNESHNHSVGAIFVQKAIESGLLIMPPKGSLKNVIKISPPLIIRKSTIASSLEIIDSILGSL
jgi:acetylornithine/N-succinyldiaminopimelate aminotransferase